jgi:release factor glutamine methyltransferase
MMTPDLGDWQGSAAQKLAKLSDLPALEARLLLAHVTGREPSWLLAHPEASLNSDDEQALDLLLKRRLAGEPLPYLLGEWQFYGLSFYVSPAALIPRPETELLVETALAWLRHHPGRNLAADIGTGSGCIAVTLAKHIPDLSIWAVDLSPEALILAQRNADRHGVADRIHFTQGDLFTRMPVRVDLVCANLPYIPTQILNDLPVARFEPRLALDGGPDGLSLIRRLLLDLPQKLVSGGLGLLEIEAGQGQAAMALAGQVLPADRIALHKDLAGHDRLVVIEMGDGNDG